MNRRAAVENRRDRKALVADAGYGKVSVVSLLAGVLVAYGAFALLAGPASAVLEALDVETDLAANWDEVGVGGGLVVAAVLFVSYLFGGYVGGRMARRAGTTHGLGVFVLGILALIVSAATVTMLGGSDDILDRLRDLGLPTTAGEWGDVGTIAGLASLAAMLVGSLLGGSLGERWHAKLLARAVDPDVGAEASARRRAEEASTVAGERHTESVQRVDAANPSRHGTYSDGTRPLDAGTRDDSDYDDSGRAVDPNDQTMTGGTGAVDDGPTPETSWQRLTRRTNGDPDRRAHDTDAIR